MKFSIVTPSFNQAAYLERSLQSVARQRGADIEHVVMDAASTDGSVEILQRHGGSVRWRSERDRGQAHAVNRGIRETGGEIIGWLNSDDVYYPGAVEKVAAFMAAHPEVDVVYGMADHIDAQDQVLGPYPTRPWSLPALMEQCIVCQPAAFFRRRAVDRHGMLDESLNYCMDYEYWLRLAQGGAHFAYLEEKLAASRLHPGTKTLGSRLPVHAEINDMLKRRLGRVPDRWLMNYGFAAVDAGESAPHGMARRWRALRIAMEAARRWNGALPGVSFWWNAARNASPRPPVR